MTPATAAHRSKVRASLSMPRIGWANVGESVVPPPEHEAAQGGEG